MRLRALHGERMRASFAERHRYRRGLQLGVDLLHEPAQILTGLLRRMFRPLRLDDYNPFRAVSSATSV